MFFGCILLFFGGILLFLGVFFCFVGCSVVFWGVLLFRFWAPKPFSGFDSWNLARALPFMVARRASYYFVYIFASIFSGDRADFIQEFKGGTCLALGLEEAEVKAKENTSCSTLETLLSSSKESSAPTGSSSRVIGTSCRQTQATQNVGLQVLPCSNGLGTAQVLQLSRNMEASSVDPEKEITVKREKIRWAAIEAIDQGPPESFWGSSRAIRDSNDGRAMGCIFSVAAGAPSQARDDREARTKFTAESLGGERWATPGKGCARHPRDFERSKRSLAESNSKQHCRAAKPSQTYPPIQSGKFEAGIGEAYNQDAEWEAFTSRMKEKFTGQRKAYRGNREQLSKAIAEKSQQLEEAIEDLQRRAKNEKTPVIDLEGKEGEGEQTYPWDLEMEFPEMEAEDTTKTASPQNKKAKIEK